MTRTPPKIPNYEILEKLGEGGMASVWLALRRGDSRASVVKVLHEHLANDNVVQSRFLREAQVAALLDHPNVARLYDAERASESSYLAMEFIAGQDLEAMMFKLADQRKLLPPELSITVTLRVLEGLHYAHEYKDSTGRYLEIVHRDLSPRNVMVTFDGKVKIIDFGLVRTNLGDFRTAPGMIAGTLRYMSPEQATADRIDRRSDLYTWSVVLFELLSGTPLVVGSETRSILGAVVVDIAPLLSTRNPNLPRALDGILAKALEKDPAQRFQSALELRDALALAAGPLGMAKPEDIGAFVSSLFPREQETAIKRLASTERPSEGPALETTRVAESNELSVATFQPKNLEATVTDHYVPRPLLVPARSPLPWIAAIAAITASLVAAIAFLLPRNEEQPLVLLPPPPPSEEISIKATAAPDHSVAQVESTKPLRRAQKSAAKRSTPSLPPSSPPPPEAPPPPPEDSISTLDLVAAFTRDADARVGAERRKQIYKSCGLLDAVFRHDEPMIRQKHVECRQMLDREPP